MSNNFNIDFWIPVLIGVGLVVCNIWYQVGLRRLLKSLGDPKILYTWITKPAILRYISPLTITLFGVLLLLGNRVLKTESVFQKADVNIHFILDNSLSMKTIVRDVTRYDIMQKATIGLIKEYDNAKVMSATYFSGEYYPVCPATEDKKTLLEIVSKFENNQIGVEGSDLSNLNSFLSKILNKDSTASTEDIFILFTDGDFSSMPVQSDSAQNLITVCIGEGGSSLLHLDDKVITSKANPKVVQQLSTLGFLSSSNSKEIKNNVKEIIENHISSSKGVIQETKSEVNSLLILLSLFTLLFIIVLKW